MLGSTPFDIQIDKTALQTRQETEIEVTIKTTLTDWGYTVSSEKGKISDINKNSFIYIAPCLLYTSHNRILILIISIVRKYLVSGIMIDDEYEDSIVGLSLIHIYYDHWCSGVSCATQDVGINLVDAAENVERG